ncbi:MAG: family N-acetyltransferase [Rickettsiales bacterium]|jgi:aminoglycoside 6'-N-acetyltransferase|nr:family N-acetyltransferase [Rickettsiales bacterium]
MRPLPPFVRPCFVPFGREHLSLYFAWAECEHVRSQWFRNGYESPNAIFRKLEYNTTDFPFIIEYARIPIGYIQYYDLSRFDPPPSYLPYKKDTAGIDIFIGEEAYLSRGLGTSIVEDFTNFLFQKGFRRVILDPFPDNARAIRCYEKAGFHIANEGRDSEGNLVTLMVRPSPCWHPSEELEYRVPSHPLHIS